MHFFNSPPGPYCTLLSNGISDDRVTAMLLGSDGTCCPQENPSRFSD